MTAVWRRREHDLFVFVVVLVTGVTVASAGLRHPRLRRHLLASPEGLALGQVGGTMTSYSPRPLTNSSKPELSRTPRGKPSWTPSALSGRASTSR